jgi:hypothetical protein
MVNRNGTNGKHAGKKYWRAALMKLEASLTRMAAPKSR